LTLTIATLNIRGNSSCNGVQRRFEKHNELKTLFKIHNLDIIILTETKNTPPESFFPYQGIATPHSHHGTIILYKNNITLSHHNIIVEGRRIDAQFQKDNLTINISAVYFPAHKDLHTFKRILKDNNNDIIIGDFNIATKATDTSTGRPDKSKSVERKTLNAFIEKYNYIDSAELSHNLSHTFFRKDFSSRIDKILTKEKHKPLTYANIQTSTLFDHNMILVKIQTTKKTKEWRLNDKMLQNSHFLRKIQYWTKKTIDNLPINPEAWEQGKNKIRKKLQKIQQFYNHKRNCKEKKLIDHQKLLCKDPQANLKQIQKNKEKLCKLNAKYNKFTLDRWLKYNFKLNNHCLHQDLINKIKYNQDNQPETILTANDHYENLENIMTYDNQFNMNELNSMLNTWKDKLNKNQIKELNKPFTIKEIKETIKSKTKKSAPGPDGLTYTIYRKTCNLICKYLTELFNSFMINLTPLTTTMKTSKTIMIYKKKGDPNLPGNWRPIALSNTDYKLYTTLLNNRLNLITSTIINKYQTGFLHNRFIIENIIVSSELLNSKPKKFAIINLDIAKAFDSIYHQTITCTLNHLGAGNITKAIQNLLYETSTIIQFNGNSSKPLTTTRGVKQGDCISPTLFIISIEIFTKNVLEKIKGLSLFDNTIKITQYADDTTIYCQDEEDISTLTKILETTKPSLGLTTNLQKSIGIAHNLPLPNNIQMISQPERFLGYYFHNELTNNLDDIIEQIKKKATHLRNFKKGNFISRASIFNTFIASKIWYWAWGIDPTEEQINKLNNITKWFIFHGGSEFNPNKRYLSYVNISRGGKPFKEGGLSIYDYSIRFKAHKIALIEKMLKSKDSIFNNIIHKLILEAKPNKNHPITQWINEWIQFIKKNKELMKYKEPIPLKIIYAKLMQRTFTKHKMTNKQKIWDQKLNKKFNLLTPSLNQLNLTSKQKYFIWRYFNGCLKIMHTQCHLCNNQTSTKHIFFECKPIIKTLKEIEIENFKFDPNRWNEDDTMITIIKQKIQKFRIISHSHTIIIIAIIQSLWKYFCHNYYGKRKKLTLTNLKKNIETFVTHQIEFNSSTFKNGYKIRSLRKVNHETTLTIDKPTENKYIYYSKKWNNPK
jgi:hypothetical protein